MGAVQLTSVLRAEFAVISRNQNIKIKIETNSGLLC